MSPPRKCTACSGTNSRPCFVYVIGRADEPWTKIGTTHAVGRRMATYRRRGLSVAVERRVEFCCESAATTVESAAHSRLERAYERREGDWFNADAATSIAALEAAQRSRGVRDLL